MHKLLIVAHQFPPAGGIGVQRILRFSRDLAEKGWKIVILTGTGQNYAEQDPSLLQDINREIDIVRVDLPSFFLNLQFFFKNLKVKRCGDFVQRLFFHFWIFDDFYQWIPFAFFKGSQIIKNFQPDIILATGSPFCSLITANLLSDYYKIPFVADFRDGWHGCEYRRKRGKLPQLVEMLFEKYVLKRCMKSLFVTKGLLKSYVKRYKQYALKFAWLPNGFDSENLNYKEDSIINKDSDLNIKYIGKFTKYRRPDSFLNALKKTLDLFQCSNIVVEFVGGLDDEGKMVMRQLGVSDNVRITEFIPHNEAVKCISQADILLLIVDRTPGYRVIQTGKIFEYMISRRPILCISPYDSEAAFTVRDENLGVVVDPEDENMIADILKNFSVMKKEKGYIPFNCKELSDTYNQKNISVNLISCLIYAKNEYK